MEESCGGGKKPIRVGNYIECDVYIMLRKSNLSKSNRIFSNLTLFVPNAGH